MSIICPKCGYVRKPEDQQFAPLTECPSCGIVYSKFGTAPRRPEPEPTVTVKQTGPESVVITDVQIPFGTMFKLCFQFALAATPAAIVAALIVFGVLTATGLLGRMIGSVLLR